MPWSHWVGVGVRLQPVLHTKAAPGQALPGILRVLKIGQEFNAARDENPAPLWQRGPGPPAPAAGPGGGGGFFPPPPGVGRAGARGRRVGALSMNSPVKPVVSMSLAPALRCAAMRSACTASPLASTVSTASGAAIG